jgi:hypothetical protein
VPSRNVLTQSWRGKSAVFRIYSALTSNGYRKSIKAVRRQRNLGLISCQKPGMDKNYCLINFFTIFTQILVDRTLSGPYVAPFFLLFLWRCWPIENMPRFFTFWMMTCIWCFQCVVFEYLIKRKGVWKVESVFFNKNDFFP